MRSSFPYASAAMALALSLAFRAAAQDVPEDRKALEEKLRDLEAKQEETRRALEALKASLVAPPPAARSTGPVEAPGLKPLDLGSSGSTG